MSDCSLQSMLMPRGRQGVPKSTGRGVVFDCNVQFEPQSNRDCSSIVRSRIGSPNPQDAHGNMCPRALKHPSTAYRTCADTCSPAFCMLSTIGSRRTSYFRPKCCDGSSSYASIFVAPLGTCCSISGRIAAGEAGIGTTMEEISGEIGRGHV